MPGSTKNSISICSNSRVRKMKLCGVISLRKLLPICAIPNGSFRRETVWICGKFTNIPWAVSGRRYATCSSSLIGPRCVSSIRLNCLASVNVMPPQFGQAGAPSSFGSR